MSKWQPIKTAPKDGRTVLVVSMKAKKPEVCCAFFAHDLGISGFNGWVVGSYDDYKINLEEGFEMYLTTKPSHWVELPAPPACNGSHGKNGK